MQERQKQEYYHMQEKQILNQQIGEYRGTVDAQAQLIEELKRKLETSNQILYMQGFDYRNNQENISAMSNQQSMNVYPEPTSYQFMNQGYTAEMQQAYNESMQNGTDLEPIYED